MEKTPDSNMHFMQVPGAPQLPPIYPPLNNQHLQHAIPPVVYYNNGQVPVTQQQPPSQPQDPTPASVFIVQEKLPIGPDPIKTTCPHCNTPQTSMVVSKISLKTHFAALICCVLGLVCLVPLPYCMNAFKNQHHYCNNCGQYLGSYPAK